MKRIRRAALAMSTIVLVVVGGLAGTMSPAAAYATGSQAWSAFCLGPWCTVGGVLHHTIYGSGRTITADTAAANAARVCNWRMDFRYTNAYTGKTYRTYRGTTNAGCTSRPSRTVYPGTLPYNGAGCVALYSNGNLLAEQCHSVYS